MVKAYKDIFLSAAILGVFGVLGAALVAGTWNATAERIALNQQQAFLRNVHKLVKPEEIDNDLLKDVITIHSADLAKTEVRVYRARKQGEPVAVIFSPVQGPGYASPIQMMVAVRADGVLGGVRVLAHMETPGLGDKIEEERSDWILGFAGKSLQNPPPEKWKVKKDGGVFDQFTGATITPRSIVATVKKTLEYFEKEKERLFKQPTEQINEAPFH
ncbi:electron transport complex subunit RsxG [Thiolapillus sp.]